MDRTDQVSQASGTSVSKILNVAQDREEFWFIRAIGAEVTILSKEGTTQEEVTLGK